MRWYGPAMPEGPVPQRAHWKRLVPASAAAAFTLLAVLLLIQTSVGPTDHTQHLLVHEAVRSAPEVHNLGSHYAHDGLHIIASKRPAQRTVQSMALADAAAASQDRATVQLWASSSLGLLGSTAGLLLLMAIRGIPFRRSVSHGRSSILIPTTSCADAWLALPHVGWAMLATSGDIAPAEESTGHLCKVHLQYSRPIAEGDRSLVDYVQLPAKQYSVLDSKQVTRLTDDTFRIHFGDMKLLGLLRLAPSADVTVEVPARGAIQTMQGVAFEGKPQRLIDAMNRLFAQMTWVNEVSAEPLEEGISKLSSSVTLDWVLPESYPVKGPAMDALVTRLMNFMMPWMLSKLEQDYARWAAGDDTRAAVTRGEIAQLTADFMAQNRDLIKTPATNPEQDNKLLHGSKVAKTSNGF